MSWRELNISPQKQLFILLILALGLNINTVFNEYVLDDAIVLTENTVIQKGIKGIPEILSTDLYYGCRELTAKLSEPRYRPFSLVIFALEYQLFGKNAFVSHSINVLLFALLIGLLFQLLRKYIFKEQHPYLAFICCLLFVAHPIHTEVIANVKSRDELITFTLLILSTSTFIKYLDKSTIPNLVISIICFFLALLTRESAVAFLAILPLILFLFFNRTIKQALLLSVPWLTTTAIYLVLRHYILANDPQLSDNSFDVFNSPFLLASSSEAFATKFYILLKYILLLFFPHPLSWDYGFQQIHYIDITSIQFILSFVVVFSLLIFALFTLRKKTVVSFSILYFFATISLVSNFVVDVGTPLSERFLFQPSLAVCILLAVYYFKFLEKNKFIVNTFLITILILFSVKTVMRNTIWKDNDILMITDVNSAPDSFRTNKFAAGAYLNKANNETNQKIKIEYYQQAAGYGEYALKMIGHEPALEIDLGNIYLGLSDYSRSAKYFEDAYKTDPSNPETKKRLILLSDIFYNEGNKQYRNNEINKAIDSYKRSVELNNVNLDAWYNLGGCYFKVNDTKNAIEAWQVVKQLSPDHQFNREAFSEHGSD
ncbi:MAG: tetratricopeptide repeat protein [Bacteroidetes bacterium]|nr:tetratricopeptide repeat protein [Bacteroidota bacterium]